MNSLAKKDVRAKASELTKQIRRWALRKGYTPVGYEAEVRILLKRKFSHRGKKIRGQKVTDMAITNFLKESGEEGFGRQLVNHVSRVLTGTSVRGSEQLFRVSHLLALSVDELASVPDFGAKGFQLVQVCLKANGLKLRRIR